MTLTHPHTVVQTHSAKSGAAWTDEDLRLCNVDVIDADVKTFFGREELPTPSVSPAILNTKASFPQHPHSLPAQTALTNEERLFIQYLEAAMVPGNDQAGAIILFTVYLLQLLGYAKPSACKQHPEEGDKERRVLRRDHDLPLFMCGRTVHAPADLCLLCPDTETHLGDTILLLAKATIPDTSTAPGHLASPAEAQLTAQAIAAFQCKNRDRRRAHLPPIETQIVPAIIMNGSAPMLYKILVTADLVECVQTAQVPPKVTSVQRLVVSLPRPEAREEGMVPLDNRKIMLGCLEAFKAFI